MARPLQEGLRYFPMDVGFFEDSKIKILRARYGADGVTVYLYYICRIYADKGYYLKINDDFDYTASLDLGMSVQKIEQIRRFLLERSLLDGKLFQSDTILTARSIQSRFMAAKKNSKRPVIVEERYWLLDGPETESFIKLRRPGNKPGKNCGNSGKNPGESGNNPLKENKANKKDDDERGDEFIDFLSDFTETWFAPNPIQKGHLKAMFEQYGAFELYEALEETGKRNVKDPIAYMRTVLETYKRREAEP